MNFLLILRTDAWQRVEKFVEKRTQVMVTLNKLAKQMAPNDAKIY